MIEIIPVVLKEASTTSCVILSGGLVAADNRVLARGYSSLHRKHSRCLHLQYKQPGEGRRPLPQRLQSPSWTLVDLLGEKYSLVIEASKF